MSQIPPSDPNPNLIETRAGYSVEVLGRTGLRYNESHQTIFIDSEVLAVPQTIAVNAASIKRWDPPHDGEPIHDQDRTRIIENIRRAFDSKGWILRVTWPFGELEPDGTWHSSTQGPPITLAPDEAAG
jgi:hypothetical protein